MPLCALDECLRRRVTVLFEQTLFQTAAVDADADGDAALPAGLGHLADIVRLADVAGVDADLVHARLRRCERKAIVKVDISHDRDGRGAHPPMATEPTWICFVCVLFISTPISLQGGRSRKKTEADKSAPAQVTSLEMSLYMT